MGTGRAPDDLPRQNTMLAADSRLLSWIRTTLSMIGFGFTIDKVLEASPGPCHVVQCRPQVRRWSHDAARNRTTRVLRERGCPGNLSPNSKSFASEKAVISSGEQVSSRSEM